MKNKYKKVTTLLPRNKGIESKYLDIVYRPSTNNSNYNLNKSCDIFINTLAYADLKRDRKRVKQVIEKFYEVLTKCNNINEITNFDKLLKKLYRQGGYASIFYESADKMLNKEGKTLAEKLLDEIKYEKKYGPIADFSEPFFYDEEFIIEEEPSTKVVNIEQNRYITKKSIDILKQIQKEYLKEEKKRERKRIAQKAYRARLKLKKLAGIKEEPIIEEKPTVSNDTINLITELDNFLKEKDASLEDTTTIEIVNLLESEPLEEKINNTIKVEKVVIDEKTNTIKYLDVSEEEEAIKELERPDALERHEEKVQRELIKEDYLTRCEFAFNKVARFTHTRIKSDYEIRNLIEIHKEILNEMEKYKEILSTLEQEEITQEINNNLKYLNKELDKLNELDNDIELFI